MATTADLLGGLQRLVMVGPGGTRQAASVVATDKTSDIALVNVPEDLPVAPFADDTNLDSGTPDLALTFVSAGGSKVALHCTSGAVTDVGVAIAERAGLHHAVDHLVARDAAGHRGRAAAQRRRAR